MGNIILGLLIVALGGYFINKGRTEISNKGTTKTIEKIAATADEAKTHRNELSGESELDRKSKHEEANIERQEIKTQLEKGQLETLNKLADIQKSLSSQNEQEYKAEYERKIELEMGYSIDEIKTIMNAVISESNSLEEIGLAFFNIQNYKESKKYLKDALAKMPKEISNNALFALMVSSAKLNDYETISQIVELIESDKYVDLESFENKSIVTLSLYANQIGKKQVAEKYIAFAIARDKNDSYAHFMKGFLYMQNSNFQAAIEPLKFAVDNKNENEKGALNLIATAYRNLGDFSNSIKYSEIGATQFPLSYYFPFNKGACYTDLKNSPKKGIEYFDEAIKLERNPQVLYSKALALKRLNQLNEALELVNEVLDENPNHIDGVNLRGQIYYAMNKIDESRKDFERFKVLTNQPNLPFIGDGKIE